MWFRNELSSLAEVSLYMEKCTEVGAPHPSTLQFMSLWFCLLMADTNGRKRVAEDKWTHDVLKRCFRSDNQKRCRLTCKTRWWYQNLKVYTRSPLVTFFIHGYHRLAYLRNNCALLTASPMTSIPRKRCRAKICTSTEYHVIS